MRARRRARLLLASLALLALGIAAPRDARRPGIAPAPAASRAPQPQALAIAPRLVPDAPPAPSLDPRARALADALRAHAASLRLRAQAASSVSLAPAQDDAFARLRADAGGALELRLRPDAGTPRLIRGNPLQRAVAAPARDGDPRAATARAFLRARRGLLRLEDPDAELVLEREQSDELGRSHLRFGQRRHGLEVWPAELLVHLDLRGDVDVVDGAWVPTPAGVSVAPAIAAAEAAARARAGVPGAQGADVPDPELVIYAPGDRIPRLAWRVFVPASLSEQWRVVVDAQSGELLASWNTVTEGNVPGSGTDLFGASQPLDVWFDGASASYYLVDTAKPMYDAVHSTPPGANTTFGGIVVLDAQNQPPNSDPQAIPPLFNLAAPAASGPWLADGVSAAVNMSHVYDYYHDVLGRSSLDDQGVSMVSAVRVGVGFFNAFYLSTSNLVVFGDADKFAGSLDVVAHELTHGVTANTANLIYQNESGALNEAISDIFGEMVEAHVAGSGPDWLVGSRLTSGALRNEQNPGALSTSFGPYPAKKSQYVQTSSDNGGVHINSTIVSHAFYLLAAGLPNAIGLADASAIFYRALRFHLVANSQFVDARLACVQSAQELFPSDATRAQAVRDAFDAVEIFDGGPTQPPPTFPGTQGPDSTLFLSWDSGFGAYFLWRDELALDPIQPYDLSFNEVAQERPAVFGDGSSVYFVSAYAPTLNDLCFLPTDGSQKVETCLGFTGQVASVGVSPDANRYGFVLLSSGQRSNQITVIDLTKPPGQDTTDYTLTAPALDGGHVATVQYADVMNFTADGRYLIYDALNDLSLAAGGQVQDWSIYALDLTNGATYPVVPPIQGLDIGNPALSHRSDNYVTFDVIDQQSNASTVYALNLNGGDFHAIGSNPTGFAAPGYNGDDTKIVFSVPDAYPTGESLVQVPLASDRITPAGSQSPWLTDADYGVVYRRGPYVPEPDAGALGAAALSALAWLRKRGSCPRARALRFSNRPDML